MRLIVKRVRSPRAWSPAGQETGSSLVRRLLVLLVLISAASGFVNLIHVGGTATATIILDATIALLLCGTLTSGRLGRVEPWLVTLGICLLVSLVLLTAGEEPLARQLIAIRTRLFYAVPAVFIAAAVRSTDILKRVVAAVMATGLLLAAFGCVQYLFRAQLPDWLLFSSDTELFGYFDTDITRSTGLVGNSIVFSTYLLLVLSLWAFRAASQPSVLRWLGAIVCELGVLSTFSRLAIVLSVCTLLAAVVYGVWRHGATQGAHRLALGIVAAAIGGLCLAQFSGDIASSFVVQDLFSDSNYSAAASSAGHREYLNLAIESMNSHPWFGMGLGSQSQESLNAAQAVVITDGFHLSTLVEGGLTLLVPSVMLFVALLIRLSRAAKAAAPAERWLPWAVFVYLLGQVLVAGFINTGFYGKVPNLTFWLVFGAVIGLYPDRQNPATRRGGPSQEASIRNLAGSGAAR